MILKWVSFVNGISMFTHVLFGLSVVNWPNERKWIEAHLVYLKMLKMIVLNLRWSSFLGLLFRDVSLVELSVCLNYTLVIVGSTTEHVLIPGGYNVSEAALLRTLDRGTYPSLQFIWGDGVFRVRRAIIAVQLRNICQPLFLHPYT